MLEWVAIAVGLVGFGWAGWLDLKTTEFPDWIPYALIAAGLGIAGAAAGIAGSIQPLLQSALVGLAFLALGHVLYQTKQWGDGDAWLLGALGFLFPSGIGPAVSALPPALLLLMMFFVTGFAYMAVYSVAVGFHAGVMTRFLRSFRKGFVRVAGITVLFALLAGGLLTWYSLPAKALPIFAALPAAVFLLLVFVNYGRYIERQVFRRKIPVRELREGDVPIGEKWKTLSKREIAALKRKGGSVWIKEGVRLSMAFAFTILVQLLAGDLLSFLF
ncbi:MAG: hypothetical protein HY369_03460 [Candidatus Aenigmarchaeota archaeon]|nr:hypothetical protein [Candidatus Aenigmarchaeota archaeon]